MTLRRVAPALLAGGLLWVAAASGAQAQDDGWPHTEAEKKAQPNAASQGNFAVAQISTNDAQKLMADWETVTPVVQLVSSTRTVRNKPIVTFIVFKGCQADAAGNCNVTVDFDTFDPSGKDYDHTKAAKVWVGRLAAPNLSLQLSEAGYGLVFEDKDPVGAYRVVATVTDHQSGVSLRTEQVLTVSP